MVKTFKAKVFVKDGHRFLVPGVWFEDGTDAFDAMMSGMMMAVTLGADQEPDFLTVEARDDGTSELPHVPHFITGRDFAHGGVEVMVLSGPIFDSAKTTA
jgi:hypothetical protein